MAGPHPNVPLMTHSGHLAQLRGR